MGAAFQSRDASPLGAFVQSAVDPQAFGGGVTLSGNVTVATGPLTNLVFTTTSPVITCDGATYWDTYLAGTAPNTSPITIRHYRLLFSTGDSSTPILSAGEWQLDSGCAQQGTIRITGQTSGKVLNLPARSFRIDESLTQRAALSTLRTPIPVPPHGSYTVPDTYELLWGASGDVYGILYYYGWENVFPSDLDFTNGETCTAERTT